MKPRLIPSSLVDRVLAGTVPVQVLALFLSTMIADYWLTASFSVMIAASVTLAYVFQDQPDNSASSTEYSEVINKIQAISGQLSDLGVFLERERTRVADTEETVRRLIEEKARLEPVVNTQRQTVEAILAAYAASTARKIWKERVIGFTLGVLASLLASFAYEYFKQ